jgi:hypothetical protein
MGIAKVALGTRKGLLIVNVEGDTCRVEHEAFLGSHVSYVFFDQRSGHLFACLDDGHFGNKLFRWNKFSEARDQLPDAEAGEVWQELAMPAYPEGEKLPNGKDAVLTYQWAFAAGSDQQPGRLYLGTEPGGLFVSDDDGDHFELCRSLWDHSSRLDEQLPWMGGGRDEAAIHSVCVDPRNHDRLLVGISVAGVFASDDGLNTWQPKNNGSRADFLPDPHVEVGHDPHLLVQCASSPDALWQQNHCGIFRSVDGAENWEFVSESEQEGPANFGFAVAVDPDNSDIAWVVPAVSDMNRIAVDRKLCVSRTEDGGKSWQALRHGLPQENCYDFAFRHCLQLDGEDLIFGTACGSLYLSRDRGDQWTTLGSHFPPVYCVTPLS